MCLVHTVYYTVCTISELLEQSMNSCYILISQVNIVKTCSKLESYTLRLEISKKKLLRKENMRLELNERSQHQNQICKFAKKRN